VTLGLSIRIETEPSAEGGFIETWKFLGENSVQITLIVSIAAVIITRFPVKNEELDELQIENLKLDNEIKRLELEKLNLEFLKNDDDLDENKLIDSIELVVRNYKTSWRKSNLFRKINGYSKIDSIEIQRLRDKDPVGPPRKIPRSEFRKYILKSDSLPQLSVENAIIDVIAPAIKSGKFKWKGFYNKEIITFEMNHHKFKTHVLRGDVHFSNTFSIEVDMIQDRKIDQDGNVIVINSKVDRVIATIENGERKEFEII
jgi:hypothetical protein